MTPIATQRFFNGAYALPAMPELARRLLATFGRDDVSMRELVSLIGRDGAITTRLLRLANSARYAPSQHVSRLAEAALLIGLGPLQGLALSCSLADSFPRPQGFDRRRFWRQNLATAGYARWLAACLGLNSGLAEVGGLVLRSGQVLMLQREPGLTALVEALSGTPDSVFDLELLHFGFTHAELSAELAERWHFPKPLVNTLRTAASPLTATPFSPEGAVLRAASVMADAAEDGFDPLQQLLACQPSLVHGLELDLDALASHLPSHTLLTEPVTELMA